MIQHIMIIQNLKNFMNYMKIMIFKSINFKERYFVHYTIFKNKDIEYYPNQIYQKLELK